MHPTTPIIPGASLPETVYAKDQPPYRPLPVFKQEDGTVLMRWRMNWRERFTAFYRGDVYVWLKTFNQPLQPIKLEINQPEVVSMQLKLQVDRPETNN